MQKNILSLLLLFSSCLALLGHNTLSVDDFEWVTVGDAGNPADDTSYGSVDYEFKIMKHPITVEQYCRFLNAVAIEEDPYGLFVPAMRDGPRPTIDTVFVDGEPRYVPLPDMADKPATRVTIWNVLRFANWLQNGGEPGADTEDGQYDMSKTLSGPNPNHEDGQHILRETGVGVFVVSEDEFYKAAYYDPTKDGTGGYWLYATQSDDDPTPATANDAGDIDNPGPNVANYDHSAHWGTAPEGEGHLTTVGTAGAESYSYYGAADLNGNAWTRTDTAATAEEGHRRIVRGGAYFGSAAHMARTVRFFFYGANHRLQHGGSRLVFIEAADAASAFELWREQHFDAGQLADPEISGPDGTPAGDGVANLLKYVFGLSPWEAARDQLPVAELVDGQLLLTYVQAKGASDVLIVVEVSENLIDWGSGEGHVEVVGSVDNGDTETITVRALSLEPDADRGFIRMRVELE